VKERMVIWLVLFFVPVMLLGATIARKSDEPQKQTYQYTRVGNTKDITTRTSPGIALVGGSVVPDEAWLWLCNKSGGGDFLLLTARKDEGPTAASAVYNLGAIVYHLCNANSVSTLAIPSQEAANEAFVASKILEAHAIFILGGRQVEYIDHWKGTATQSALDRQIAKGVPVGGVGGGLAILGEYAFGNLKMEGLTSDEALKDPYDVGATLTHSFLDVPQLRGTIADSFLATRQRLGRLVSFIVRTAQDNPSQTIKGIGVDEASALLLEPNGSGAVVGRERKDKHVTAFKKTGQQ